MTPESKFVEVEGIRTHYLEAGNGPVLLLIHGGGSGADAWGNWKDCVEGFAESFHVFAVDMVGFGKTERPNPETYNYGQTSRNRHMAAFAEFIGSGRPINVVGNSMGGATALGVTINRPELVSKLVLMGAAGLDISNPDPAAKKALGSYDYTIEGMRRLVSVLAGPRFEISDELVEYRHALTVVPGAKEAMAAIHSHTADDPMTYPREALSSIEKPTLVVGGKEDQVAVLERIYGYLELLPNSYGFILPHAGHWVMMEAPSEFVKVTSTFLEAGGFEG